jgi:CBS domain-containing protein
MTPQERLTAISPDTDSAEALVRLSQAGANQLPVIEQGGRLAGLITRENILNWLSLEGGWPIRGRASLAR